MTYYFPTTNQAYTPDQILNLFGIDPRTASLTTILNRGFYPVVATPNPYDNYLYSAEPTYTVVGTAAEQSWVATPLPLDEAKAGGKWEALVSANNNILSSSCGCGFSPELLTAVASQDYFDRPARFQAELDEMTAISNQLDADLTAIDNATSVDEIDSILRHPSGTFVSGRGGAGPLDMQPSYFTVLENLPPGIGEPELEIYIPGTSTVIPYNAELPEPYKFDSMGNCYTGTDFRTVIRVAATGQVLSTVIPPAGAAVPIEWTYNPNIPSYGGGSSHSHSA